MNAFSNETCLNVKHQLPCIFQHIVLIYLNTYWYTPVRSYERRDCCNRWISRWNHTMARSFFINNTFLSTNKLLTPNMYCWSCKTLVTRILDASQSEWHLGNVFCPEKVNNRTRCSLRDAFSGSVALFIVEKWRHSYVIIINTDWKEKLNLILAEAPVHNVKRTYRRVAGLLLWDTTGLVDDITDRVSRDDTLPSMPQLCIADILLTACQTHIHTISPSFTHTILIATFQVNLNQPTVPPTLLLLLLWSVDPCILLR